MNLIKKIKSLFDTSSTENTAYFKNGILYKVEPFKSLKNDDYLEVAHHLKYLVSDGIKYDLKSVDSIKSIKIPKYPNTPTTQNAYFYIEHVLKWNLPTGDDNIDIAIMEKLIYLMKASWFSYRENDYYILPKKYYKMGQFEKGDLALEEIKKLVPEVIYWRKYMPLKKIKEIIKTFKDEFYRNDLVEIPNQHCVCEKCALYQGRIFSAYGKDKRFPKLPDALLKNGTLCEHNCLTLYNCSFYGGYTLDALVPFIKNGKEEYKRVEKEAIKYSNRPFVDERTETQKEEFEKRKAESLQRDNRLNKYRESYYKKFNKTNST